MQAVCDAPPTSSLTEVDVTNMSGFIISLSAPHEPTVREGEGREREREREEREREREERERGREGGRERERRERKTVVDPESIIGGCPFWQN